MVKRKTSCGNARMCSMLLINVTRSASYETLPNRRLFPARSGLTSRFPLRNRSWWEEADEQQRSTLEKRNTLEEGQKRGCCGSTELGIVVPRALWREIFCRKRGTGTKKEKREKGVSFYRPHNHNSAHEKLTKFREHLSQSR